MKPKSKRGGRRPGAGRKPTGTVRLVLKVKPATADALRADASSEGLTPGQYLDAAYAEQSEPDNLSPAALAAATASGGPALP